MFMILEKQVKHPPMKKEKKCHHTRGESWITVLKNRWTEEPRLKLGLK